MMIAEFKGFTLKSKFFGNKQPKHWAEHDCDVWEENWNNHVVHVYHEGVHTSFEFWGSIRDPEINTEGKLLCAFQDFLYDVIAGGKSFREFCNDFDYNHDSRKAEGIWRMCKNARRKFNRLTMGVPPSAEDLYNDLVEYLEESYEG